jgi:hypothetical protein
MLTGRCLTAREFGSRPLVYALTSANCQHFVLTFCRQIRTEFEPGILRKLSLSSHKVMFVGWLLLLVLFILLYFLPPYVVLIAVRRPLLGPGLARANLSHVSNIMELVTYTGLLGVHTPLLDYALWLFFGLPGKVEVHNVEVRTSSILRAMFEVFKRTPLRILGLEYQYRFPLDQPSPGSQGELVSIGSSKASSETRSCTRYPVSLPFVTLDGRSIVILTGERILEALLNLQLYVLGGRGNARKEF